MLAPGTQLGPYEILAPLGAGGMGEVWKAKDTRLDRLVAIKVLPEHLAAHPEALARFEREAKAVAALNHPNILALFDLGNAAGVAYAVMELLEGETLRDRLHQGPLPPRKALELAVQMAQGLAAAHAKGVVHRDLKPENLWITREGRLKILDFGLAKQVVRTDAASNSLLPTEAIRPGSHQTEKGAILGTVGYMSPEQVRGETVDARSDLFSFGVVLFEMLTARQAFVRGNSGDTLAAILRDDPPELEDSGRPIPPSLQKILNRCLEKEPSQRFQGASDLAFALAALGSSSDSGAGLSAPALPAPGTRLPRLAPWLLGATAGLLLGLASLAFRPSPPASSPVIAFRPLSYSGRDYSPAASPDGRTVAFTSDRDGLSRIWMKQLKGGDERALTDGGDDFPRFSPDGSSILFVHRENDHRSLQRISLLGSEPKVVAQDALSADWSPDGSRIAYVRVDASGPEPTFALMAIPSGGGSPKVVADFGPQALGVPRWSPDGKHILLSRTYLNASGAQWVILLVDAETGRIQEMQPPRKTGALSGAAWVDATHFVCIQSESPAGNGTAVSPARAYLQDTRTQACTPLFWLPGSPQILDLLPDGRLVCDVMTGRQNLREFDLPGRNPLQWLTRGSISDRQPVYSPDGEWVTFSSNRTGNLDIWSVSTRTGKVRSLTDDPADDWDPAYTPDGKSLLWSSNRGGHLEIWMAEADGSNPRQVSHDGEDAENPTMTRDGQWIIYTSGNPKGGGIWRIHPDGSGAVNLVPLQSVALPELSPDGRFVAYRKIDFNRVQVLVSRVEDGKPTAFLAIPRSPGMRAIRAQGQTPLGRARWSPDGRRLFFTGQNEQGGIGVLVQDFDPDRDTSATLKPFAGFEPDLTAESFGVSPDGKRMTISESVRELSLVMVEGLKGLERKTPSR